MVRFTFLLSICFSLVISMPCYAWIIPITGTVVENETGKPIEGTIIYVEWNITKGLPGLTYTEDYKTKETRTNAHGQFKVSGIINPLPHIAHITIYKIGFLAWNNIAIFDSYENRKDWYNGSEVKLRNFTPDYTSYGHKYNHYEHVKFIRQVTPDAKPDSIIRKAIEWEEENARKESNSRQRIKITGKVVDAKTGEPIPKALCVVAGYGMGYSLNGSYSEFLSDRNGNIKILGTYPMIIRPPYLIIYKKGFVAWDSYSILIFDHYRNEFRKDFKWQDGYTFKLEKWKQSYSHKKHYNFTMSRFPHYHAIQNGKLKKAVEWERKK